MKRLLLLPVIPFIMGCAWFPFFDSPTPPQPSKTLVITKCPVLKSYSKEQLTEASAELKGLAADSKLALLITDYSKMRDACRAIVKKTKQ